jgi:hypothetical protein
MQLAIGTGDPFSVILKIFIRQDYAVYANGAFLLVSFTFELFYNT